MKKPVMLMILDGWGYAPCDDYNAVCRAKTPNLSSYIEKYPNSFIKCSGLDVGLPSGYMGNSEVGHLNLGAGRIVYQDLTRIDKAILDGDFFENKNIMQAFEKAKKNGGKVHLTGLLSDGGVHSHINHLKAFFDFAKKIGFKDLVVHPLFDGRDTAPKIGDVYLETVLNWFKEYGFGSLGVLSGRYYAMDRDKRWDRVRRAYDAFTLGTPLIQTNSLTYIKELHAKDIGDEFIEPVCVDMNNIVKDGDVVIFFNFRSDRARELTTTFTDKNFSGFSRTKFPKIDYFLCMTEYDETFNLPVAFPSETMTNLFGEVISNEGLKQLRIAETEKYAHVTFFFNGGKEENFKGEDRALIESPREVATYDLKPQMSAYQVTERVLKEIDKDFYDLIILNFANCDMVGHTGIMEAAIKAVETIDECSAKVIEKILQKDGVAFVTADHGNAEKMMEKGHPHTAHTTNPVRLVLVSKEYDKSNYSLKDGKLADIMPTMLGVMKINVPKEATGENLLIKNKIF